MGVGLYKLGDVYTRLDFKVSWARIMVVEMEKGGWS